MRKLFHLHICPLVKFIFQEHILYLLGDVLVFLCGGFLVWLGLRSPEGETARLIWVSVGTSVIASGIVVLLDIWRELCKQKILSRAYSIVLKAGISDVFPKRDLDRYDELMHFAKTRIDITGYTLNAWFESYGDIVSNKMREENGLYIRILMVDPTSDVSKQRAALEGRGVQSAQDSVDRIMGAFRGVGERIQIRLLCSPLTTMIFRIDDTMFVGPHLYRKQSKATLTFQVESSGWLFKAYDEEFERLWSAGAPVEPPVSSG